MPAQDLNSKQSVTVLKEFKNMPPAIAPNNSQEQLMRHGEQRGDDAVSGGGTLRDIKRMEWVAILILCFVNLINYMDRFTLAGILTDVQDYYKIGDGPAGLLQTSFILSYMIFAPLFGYLGDRHSRKLIMAFGVFLWSLTTFIGSFMDNFIAFTTFRALVGIGEASYSTIAPTIISDLFVGDNRSKMLAMFYFAIPVGSGLGYIVGSETAKLLEEWQYALRVTPILGIAAVLLILFVLKDPERGQSEGSGHLATSPLKEDLKALSINRSFILSTMGFTCVAFVAGALAWWGPKLLHLGMAASGNGGDQDSVSLNFGIIAMFAGLIGVPLGSAIAQRLRLTHPHIDPEICGFALLFSAPMVYFALVTASYSTSLCYLCIFLGMASLNLTWSIVADILLYVVLPTRRSTAEGVQLLVSHALGDAGSPYLIGIISEALKVSLRSDSKSSTNTEESDFHALQYALLLTCFIEVLGGFFFLLNSFFIVDDRRRVDEAVKEKLGEPARLLAVDTDDTRLVD
ncbi:protein spinster isoform X2 [Atheta coriaria]|uniref:protein spinster isoform X2 n=1 Tax=Dalotia coriaria TaxID=877792 RepID=UPI0031F3D3A7